MNTVELKKRLDNLENFQDKLFVRSWLLTEKSFEDKMSEFPFYGHWKSEKVGRFYLMTQEKMQVHHVTVEGRTFFLFGHAYNPFTLEWEEEKELQKIAKDYGKDSFWHSISELTGIFAMGWYNDKEIHFITDPSGMQSTFYGLVDNNIMLTSHPQIIGDLYDLEMQPIARELVEYKWYGRIMGSYLPGDLSPFKEVTRVVPNIEYTFSGKKIDVKRFYPLHDVEELADSEYREAVEQAAGILKNGAALVMKKWKRPAISLTGGIDSNTTFAALNGHYDKLRVFSYLSAPKEVPDVEAAKTIAKRFNVAYDLYEIPDSSDNIEDFLLQKEIIDHTNGYIVKRFENETRKRIFLAKHLDYDVEIKSWVSESVRAYWYKYYHRKSFPKMSPKLFRNLYKIFLTNRCLAHKVDKIFSDFMVKYGYWQLPKGFDPSDMHQHEVMISSKGAMDISEMKYYTDITILYNNRIWLDLMNRVPFEKRLNDQHHLDMKKLLNKELFDMNIRVVDKEQTVNRSRMLNAVFTLNSILPF
jgi:hypothetical protein